MHWRLGGNETRLSRLIVPNWIEEDFKRLPQTGFRFILLFSFFDGQCQSSIALHGNGARKNDEELRRLIKGWGKQLELRRIGKRRMKVFKCYDTGPTCKKTIYINPYAAPSPPPLTTCVDETRGGARLWRRCSPRELPDCKSWRVRRGILRYIVASPIALHCRHEEIRTASVLEGFRGTTSWSPPESP